MSETNAGNGHFPFANKKAALVVAHPGHELKVHGWLEAARPLVFVLTDGSGRSTQSRLGSTTAVIEQARAQVGGIYGCFTDRAAYAAILNHHFDLFIELAGKLSRAFVNERIDLVAGDAMEGYNPMHDVCRLVIDAAVEAAAQTAGQTITNLAFSLVDDAPASPGSPQANEFWLQLDEEAFQRKITAAYGYHELAGEVYEALEGAAVDGFRVERLRAPDSDVDVRYWSESPPFYEQYGEKQVAAGHYDRVLRYSQHVKPLADTLAAWSRSLKVTSQKAGR